jgi:hypothetical protein
VHKNIIVSIDETINKFAKMKKRILEFVIWLLTNLMFLIRYLLN